MEKTRKKKYKLLQTDLTIEYKDKVVGEDNEWQFGYTQWDTSKCNIYISTKDKNGKALSKEEVEMTVRHELFHFLFSLLYYNEENNNEHLVEWLARSTQILNRQGLKI